MITTSLSTYRVLLVPLTAVNLNKLNSYIISCQEPTAMHSADGLLTVCMYRYMACFSSMTSTTLSTTHEHHQYPVILLRGYTSNKQRTAAAVVHMISVPCEADRTKKRLSNVLTAAMLYVCDAIKHYSSSVMKLEP